MSDYDDEVELYAQTFEEMLNEREEEINRLKKENKKIKRAIIAMSKQLKTLEERNKIISQNMASLHYTAQLEMLRK